MATKERKTFVMEVNISGLITFEAEVEDDDDEEAYNKAEAIVGELSTALGIPEDDDSDLDESKFLKIAGYTLETDEVYYNGLFDEDELNEDEDGDND